MADRDRRDFFGPLPESRGGLSFPRLPGTRRTWDDRMLEEWHRDNSENIHLDLPLGVLGYAEVTSSQGSITSGTNLTGLSVSVDVASARRVRISAQGGLEHDTADSRLQLSIMESTTTLNVGVTHHGEGGTAGLTTSAFSAVIAPSEGSHTYHLRLGLLDSGTATLVASNTAPAFILVEDLGPA